MWAVGLSGALLLSVFSFVEYFVPSQNFNKAHYAATLTWMAGSARSQYFPEGGVSEIARRYWHKIIEADIYQVPDVAKQIQRKFLQNKDKATEGIDGWQIQQLPDQSIILSNPDVVTTSYWGANGNYIVTWNLRTASWDWLVASPERNSVSQLLKKGNWLKPGVKLWLNAGWLDEINSNECFLVTVHNDSVNVSRIQIV
ncbi:hypothetical protein GCM10023187_27870 [Nibrella viscosa]|uniref:Uncharacterized protein n=2 Tax=Nibrella viscosa TaxID=1084524 RepID=A0ABP8KIG4_9BACT